MQKSTFIEADLLDAIERRSSKRAYSARPIEPEKIQSLFEAARWAPSSSNEQPWTYVYATKDQPELWDKIFQLLNDGNKIWAERAPLLVVSLARKNFYRNDRQNIYAHYDVGAANAFLSLQATHIGLNVHQMGGFDRQRAKADLSIPDTHEIVVIMAIGYPDSPETLPDHLLQREVAPRERYRSDVFAMNRTF